MTFPLSCGFFILFDNISIVETPCDIVASGSSYQIYLDAFCQRAVLEILQISIAFLETIIGFAVMTNSNASSRTLQNRQA